MAHNNWYNTNTYRSYPFLEGSVNQPPSGPLTLLNLPNEVIVDCGFVFTCRSGFSYENHRVFLKEIKRVSNNVFTFTFSNDIPNFSGYPLVFTRDYSVYSSSTSGGINYIIEYQQSDDYVFDLSTSNCNEPIWYGFLVTGKLESLLTLLPNVGDTITNTPDSTIVEPTLIQNNSQSYVTSINIANKDRTRATAPPGCPPISWPFPIGQTYVKKKCLGKKVCFVPGYNCDIKCYKNTIQCCAIKGSGLGEPCSEIPLFPNEVNVLSTLSSLSGAELCNSVLLSINGISARLFNFYNGGGVVITPKPAEHKVVINVNMHEGEKCYGSS